MRDYFHVYSAEQRIEETWVWTTRTKMQLTGRQWRGLLSTRAKWYQFYI